MYISAAQSSPVLGTSRSERDFKRADRSSVLSEAPPSDEERVRFGFSKRQSRSPRCSPRSARSVQSGNVTPKAPAPAPYPVAVPSPVSASPVATGVSVASPLDHFIALLGNAAEEEALRNLLRTKLTAGRFDYKGRIAELSDFTEDLKSALLQQMNCLKEARAAAMPLQEKVNTRLALAAEEMAAQRTEAQRLNMDLAVAQQKVEAQDELYSALQEARQDRRQTIAECAERVESIQALCKREIAEAADACQRQLDETTRLRENQQELEQKITALTADRDEASQARALLMRDNAVLAGEVKALRETKQELQAQVSEKEDALNKKDERNQSVQARLLEAEKLLQQREDEVKGEISALRAKNAESEELLSQKVAELQDLQARVIAEASSRAHSDGNLQALQVQLEEKSNQLSQKDVLITQRDCEVQLLRAQLSASEGQTLMLQTRLTEQESLLKQGVSERKVLEAKLEERDDASRQQRRQLQEFEAQLRERDVILKRKDDDLRDSLQSIKQMHQSGSEQSQLERQRADKLERDIQAARKRELDLHEDMQASARRLEQLQAEIATYKQEGSDLQAALLRAENERDDLADVVTKGQGTARAQQDELDIMANRLAAAQDELVSVQTALAEKSAESDRLAQGQSLLQLLQNHGVNSQEQLGALNDLRSTVDRLSKQVEAKQAELHAQQGSAGFQSEYAQILEERLARTERARRELHNTIQELKGSIRVYCRVRPAPEFAELALESPEADKLSLAYAGEVYGFGYDKVFGPAATQVDVFDEVSGLIQSALDGYKVCLFAYGQTGSGKTFTMQGTNEPSSWGLIPRSLSKILQASKAMNAQGWSWSLKASFYEVYNETIRDLLHVGKPGYDSTLQSHAIKHDEAWGTIVTNMTSIDVDSMEQIRELTARAARQRAVGATDINSVSSRSHSIFALYLKGTNTKLNSELHGALHLVDLAGSERLDKSGSTGDRLKETQNINRSLSSLADVFLAKAERRAHVPFRNSKLTHLLEPCLSGQGKTLMLVNVCSEESNAHETLCSLRFASQVNQCNTGGRAKRTVRSITEPTPQPKAAQGVVRMQSGRRGSVGM